MPFRTYTVEGGSFAVGDRTPDPELRQVDDDSFVILRSFCYRAFSGDPDAGAVYLVPGEDFEAPTSVDPELRVVIPPDVSGRTDLASVPPLFWWLIASYGNHTRASLLHDALYVDAGEPPVPRRTADRLLLAALREPGPQKGGAFRHWLMWAAVSAFGTMRWHLGVVFGSTSSRSGAHALGDRLGVGGRNRRDRLERVADRSPGSRGSGVPRRRRELLARGRRPPRRMARPDGSHERDCRRSARERMDVSVRARTRPVHAAPGRARPDRARPVVGDSGSTRRFVGGCGRRHSSRSPSPSSRRR